MAGSDVRGLRDGVGRMANRAANAGCSGRRAAVTAWQWQRPAGGGTGLQCHSKNLERGIDLSHRHAALSVTGVVSLPHGTITDS